MRMSSKLLGSPAMTIVLTTAVIVAIAMILFVATFTIASAQQQQQPLASQPVDTQNGTTLFKNIEDGIKLVVPEGWVIHDVNNTGAALEAEATQGYGILAQLCPGEERQAVFSNVSSSGNTANCQGSEGDIIHIVRYPDLDTRLQASNNVTTNANTTTIDDILAYHLQKLQEVGYSGIEIIDSTDTTLNVINSQTNRTLEVVPAKNIEMIYRTVSAPDETRRGYFILAAADAIPSDQGMMKGYSVFYEGASTAAAAETTPATPAGSLAPIPLPEPIKQVFDSFELVTQAAPAEPLTVEITSSDTEGDVAPATFEFEANVSGGTEPYSFRWAFDGEVSEESNERTISHTFEEAGTHSVDLTVTDSEGQIGSDSMEIAVEEAPAEEEQQEDEGPGSDELVDLDGLIDDLLDRLGLGN